MVERRLEPGDALDRGLDGRRDIGVDDVGRGARVARHDRELRELDRRREFLLEARERDPAEDRGDDGDERDERAVLHAERGEQVHWSILAAATAVDVTGWRIPRRSACAGAKLFTVRSHDTPVRGSHPRRRGRYVADQRVSGGDDDRAGCRVAGPVASRRAPRARLLGALARGQPVLEHVERVGRRSEAERAARHRRLGGRRRHRDDEHARRHPRRGRRCGRRAGRHGRRARSRAGDRRGRTGRRNRARDRSPTSSRRSCPAPSASSRAPSSTPSTRSWARCRSSAASSATTPSAASSRPSPTSSTTPSARSSGRRRAAGRRLGARHPGARGARDARRDRRPGRRS